MLLKKINLKNINDIKDFNKKLYLGFDKDIIFDKNAIEKIKDIEMSLSSEKLAIWQRVLAEKILLDKNIYERNVDKGIIEYFKNIHPFENIKLSLDELIDKNIALAIIPLDGTDMGEKPQILHFWIVDGLSKEMSDHRHLLKGSEIINEKYKIFLSYSLNETLKISGKSWQLGGRLAIDALNNDKLKKNLASNWIITGVVSDNKINRIKLGNKIEINLNKNWIIPSDNRPDISDNDDTKNGKIHFIPGVNSAKNLITGESMVDGGEILYYKVNELNALVGGNPKSIILSVLLIKPRRVILWHSDNEKNSIQPARLVKKIILRISHDIDIELKEIDSRNMIKATENLKKHFNKIDIDSTIIFNVTSGNRLMAFATQNIARINTQIQLIYRDVDDKDLNMTMIRYDQIPTITLKLTSDGEERKDIDWEFLTGTERYGDEEDFLKKLLKRG